ncbi:HAMP domain-containing sensor histidine kinase [Pollutibacter soli]|uniref:sensor histidine kinase n=1 Tax=Pollutibacter soli TaxID=3034157 RepID=UPI0030134DAF
MWRQLLNWRSLLAGIAMIIVIATIFYSRYLSGQIAIQEREKVEAWAEAQQFIAKATAEQDILFATLIMAGQNTIPVIETNEADSITNYHNIDSSEVQENPAVLKSLMREYKRRNPPIITYLNNDRTQYNQYYYGESILLKQIRYYPIVQLVIVTLFIIVTLLALSTQHRATQNQLWAGMAKETAHQLGTPLSALEGWVEMMKESPPDRRMIGEMEKDIGRLKLVSDRFSKIGSTPHLETHDLIHVLQNVVDYVKKRSPEKVIFKIESGNVKELPVQISAPLFEWVVENILKNALDAMDGKGMISLHIQPSGSQVYIDITDTGKGISAANIARVFNPGFTTKKRGWGLGLTLSKRIINQYHKGELFVKHSEPGKGTTFRIVLRR